MEFLPDISKLIQILLRWGHVFFAIKNAIASVGKYTIVPDIDAPATPERILISINKLRKKI